MISPYHSIFRFLGLAVGLAVFILVLSRPGPQAIFNSLDEYTDRDFSLDLSLEEGEKSKDSHSFLTDIQIDGRLVYYRWTTTGSLSQDPLSALFGLNEEQFEELMSLVDAVDYSVYEDQEFGLGQFADLTLDISENGQSIHSELRGMVNDWESDGQAYDLENISYYESVSVLVDYLEALIPS